MSDKGIERDKGADVLTAHQRSLAWRLVAACFFFELAFQSTYFVGVIGCATYDLGLDAAGVSLLVFLIDTLQVCGTMVSGVFVDREGPRATMLVSLALLAASGLFILLVPLTYWSLLVVAVAQGFTFGMCATTNEAFPRYIVRSRAGLARINGVMNILMSVSVVVGPTLAGAIVRASSTKDVFWLLFLSPLPSILLVASMRGLASVGDGEADGVDGADIRGDVDDKDDADDADAEAPASRGFWRDVVEGARYSFAHPALRLLIAMAFLAFFAYGAFDSLESLFYRDVLHADAEWMGWMGTIVGVGGLLGSFIATRVPARRYTIALMALLLAVTGVGSMIYVGTSSLLITAIGQFITGIGWGAIGPVRATLVQDFSEKAYLGRVSAVMRIALTAAGTVPLLVAPFIAGAVGVQPVLFGASTIVAVLGFGFMAYTRRHPQG